MEQLGTFLAARGFAVSTALHEEAMPKTNRGTAGLIRQEIGSETNRRFLRSLPAFRLERQIPPRFQELLGRLDQAERNSEESRT